MDVIRLHNMTFYGYHGASSAERETGRRFEVDAELFFPVSRAARTDRLKNTIDYTKVYTCVEKVILQNHFTLLETVADRLAQSILKNFPIRKVTIRVRKKIPPIPGNLDHIEVELTRSKR